MNHFEEIAAELEQHADYRVLRRLQPIILGNDATQDPDPTWRKAVVLDTETTGVDTSVCKVIELGLKPFWYDKDGNTVRALPAVSWLEDPGEPLTQEVIDVTGLTDEMLAGQKIPDEEVAAVVGGALIIAHNSAFDRPVSERRFPWAQGAPWACSMAEIAWRAHGFPSASLPVIGTHLGRFYDAHRASGDCEALAAILHMPIGQIGYEQEVSFLDKLLTSAREPSARIWAAAAPFERKDVLKARGYRWHDGKVGRGKCWYRDMPAAEADHELAFLKNSKITGVGHAEALTAYNRYSVRSLSR